MLYTVLKATHIVFVVSWFAALFYIVRLFIYTTEAQAKPEIEKRILTHQLLLMQHRLWHIIGWPAMAITLVTGVWMLVLNWTFYLSQTWMLLKLFIVIVLLVYHLICQRLLNAQKRGVFRYSSLRLRLFNELATILLVAIVFVVILKTAMGPVYGLAGLLVLAAVLMTAVFLYRKSLARKKSV